VRAETRDFDELLGNAAWLRRSRSAIAAACLVFLGGCSLGSGDNRTAPPASFSSARSEGFTNFETEPVTPLALSEDGRFLYALNTADDRLEIFSAQGGQLRSVGEATVGLRPVALALHGKTAWVVNHLSDSVSVVDVSEPARPRLIHSLQVGDEPRGIVVAGTKRDRIFVATARAGESFTPGIGRAQLWEFDAARPAVPPRILTLFGAKPRALAVSTDGRYVYAAVYLSGNGTTTVSGEDAVRLGRARQLSLNNVRPSALPKQGAIVRRFDGRWRDHENRDWNAAVPFELPDFDLFVIDTAAREPKVVEQISNVGTVLFNIAVEPISGEVWVSNTDALNFIPYEPELRGRFAVNRITRVAAGLGGAERIRAVDLNPHLANNAGAPMAPGAAAAGVQLDRESGLAQPLDLVFQADGSQAYVALFGSRKVAVLDRAGRVVDRISVGFGPAGLALDPRGRRLYVLNHLDATISVVDLTTRNVRATTPLRHDPTPAVVRQGRSFLYDAGLTSGRGDLSCATCHVFGDVDALAWDLGDPGGYSYDYPAALKNPEPVAAPRQTLHPLKGPMITQSLRGLADTGPFHWRGDRFGDPMAPGKDVPSFKDFNAAFVDLLGRDRQISEQAMDAFARFVLSIRYPPNPNQRLDRRLGPVEKAGFDFFTGPFPSGAGVVNCENCHKLPLGTNRLVNFEDVGVGRDMKTAHLRNAYQKIGRFNTPGLQVSGYGFLHDGSFDTVANFLRLDTFIFPGNNDEEKETIRRSLQSYIMAFDTGMAPSVGRQLTVSGELRGQEREVLDILMARATAGDCDFTARGWEGKSLRGWLYANGVFRGDRSAESTLDIGALLDRHRRSAEPVTFTCVPPGDGVRSALDRDLDGYLDGDERRAGSDPASAQSIPPPEHSMP
jgi:YVTN family beta-propeller protein